MRRAPLILYLITLFSSYVLSVRIIVGAGTAYLDRNSSNWTQPFSTTIAPSVTHSELEQPTPISGSISVPLRIPPASPQNGVSTLQSTFSRVSVSLTSHGTSPAPQPSESHNLSSSSSSVFQHRSFHSPDISLSTLPNVVRPNITTPDSKPGQGHVLVQQQPPSPSLNWTHSQQPQHTASNSSLREGILEGNASKNRSNSTGVNTSIRNSTLSLRPMILDGSTTWLTAPTGGVHALPTGTEPSKTDDAEEIPCATTVIPSVLYKRVIESPYVAHGNLHERSDDKNLPLFRIPTVPQHNGSTQLEGPAMNDSSTSNSSAREFGCPHHNHLFAHTASVSPNFDPAPADLYNDYNDGVRQLRNLLKFNEQDVHVIMSSNALLPFLTGLPSRGGEVKLPDRSPSQTSKQPQPQAQTTEKNPQTVDKPTVWPMPGSSSPDHAASQTPAPFQSNRDGSGSDIKSPAFLSSLYAALDISSEPTTAGLAREQVTTPPEDNSGLGMPDDRPPSAIRYANNPNGAARKHAESHQALPGLADSISIALIGSSEGLSPGDTETERTQSSGPTIPSSLVKQQSSSDGVVGGTVHSGGTEEGGGNLGGDIKVGNSGSMGNGRESEEGGGSGYSGSGHDHAGLGGGSGGASGGRSAGNSDGRGDEDGGNVHESVGASGGNGNHGQLGPGGGYSPQLDEKPSINLITRTSEGKIVVITSTSPPRVDNILPASSYQSAFISDGIQLTREVQVPPANLIQSKFTTIYSSAGHLVTQIISTAVAQQIAEETASLPNGGQRVEPQDVAKDRLKLEISSLTTLISKNGHLETQTYAVPVIIPTNARNSLPVSGPVYTLSSLTTIFSRNGYLTTEIIPTIVALPTDSKGIVQLANPTDSITSSFTTIFSTDGHSTTQIFQTMIPGPGESITSSFTTTFSAKGHLITQTLPTVIPAIGSSVTATFSTNGHLTTQVVPTLVPAPEAFVTSSLTTTFTNNGRLTTQTQLTLLPVSGPLVTSSLTTVFTTNGHLTTETLPTLMAASGPFVTSVFTTTFSADGHLTTQVLPTLVQASVTGKGNGITMATGTPPTGSVTPFSGAIIGTNGMESGAGGVTGPPTASPSSAASRTKIGACEAWNYTLWAWMSWWTWSLLMSGVIVVLL